MGVSADGKGIVSNLSRYCRMIDGTSDLSRGYTDVGQDGQGERLKLIGG